MACFNGFHAKFSGNSPSGNTDWIIAHKSCWVGSSLKHGKNLFNCKVYSILKEIWKCASFYCLLAKWVESNLHVGWFGLGLLPAWAKQRFEKR